MIAPVTHILPLTSLRRARILPDKGSVLVRVGQKVSAVEIVAEAPPRRKHLLVDVSSSLGARRKQDAKSLIVRKVGDRLQAGDIIAETRRMFRRVLRAPTDCEIIMISGGMVLLEVKEAPIQLQAGFTGTVVEVIPEKGVIIQTMGALVQGAWGNGKIDVGSLVVLTQDPAGELEQEQLDLSLRGAVGLSGRCLSEKVLRAAADLPLQGLVLGSMPASLLPLAQQLPIPIILLEGFGSIPVNTAAFKLLLANEKREVAINAAVRDHYLNQRPELVIPLPSEEKFSPETVDLQPGLTVRVMSAPYLGMLGSILEINRQPVVLANGLRARAATLILDSSERVQVPLTDLEVLA